MKNLAAMKMNLNRKNLIWKFPLFGRGTIFFGVGAKNFTAQAKQYTAFVRFLDGLTDCTKETAKIFGGEADFFSDGDKSLTPAINDASDEVEYFKHQSQNSNDDGNQLSSEAEYPVGEPKHSSLQFKSLNGEIKIFTFGLFVLKVDSRIRAGFVKRHQILVEA